MSIRGVIIPIAMALCVVAVLFPPHGYMGRTFDHFAFAFSAPYLTDYPSLRAEIVWHLVGIEVAVILFAAVGLHWFLKERAKAG